jgi:hypothetical protein
LRARTVPTHVSSATDRDLFQDSIPAANRPHSDRGAIAGTIGRHRDRPARPRGTACKAGLKALKTAHEACLKKRSFV